MTVFAGNLTSVGNPFDFSLSFARQPEPDLEFTEEELDQTTATRPMSPMKQPKKSGGRPLLWILLLALIGGIGYIALEPEQMTAWLAPLLNESTPKQPAPSVAKQPKAPAEPTAISPPPQPASPSGGMMSTPTTQPEGVPPSASPVPPAPPAATMPAPVAPSVPPMTATPEPIMPARTTSSPLFSEGQRVTVMGNPTAPGEMVPLTSDPAGSKPGPSVRPGVTLSILDGDLQPSGWVYSVRTDDGVKGWVPEKRLRMKF